MTEIPDLTVPTALNCFRRYATNKKRRNTGTMLRIRTQLGQWSGSESRKEKRVGHPINLFIEIYVQKRCMCNLYHRRLDVFSGAWKSYGRQVQIFKFLFIKNLDPDSLTSLNLFNMNPQLLLRQARRIFWPCLLPIKLEQNCYLWMVKYSLMSSVNIGSL